MAFKRKYIIKRRRDFVAIQSEQAIRGKYVVVCFRSSILEHIRVGFTVSKKVGKAHVRNFCKRRLREVIYNLLKEKTDLSLDIVLIAKPSIKYASWNDVCQDVGKSIATVLQ